VGQWERQGTGSQRDSSGFLGTKARARSARHREAIKKEAAMLITLMVLAWSEEGWNAS
jgi:hypothetical protein